MTSESSISTLLESLQNGSNEEELHHECQRWALAHGFVQRRFVAQDHSYVIPYPFTVYPSPYPRHEYNRALQLQSTINALIHRLATNTNLMDSIFNNLIDCDPFIKRLREIYHQVQTLPYRSVAEASIIRTDYMLQSLSRDTERTRLRLIEINTIAVGLAAAAKLMHMWHKRILLRIKPEWISQLPDNESHDLVIDTLKECWKLYNNQKAIILFIVPEQEFNVGDQLLIEQGLVRQGQDSPLVKHVPMHDVCRHCSTDTQGRLYFDQHEVAIVYYRYGYDPRHFTSEEIWHAYLMLESSKAIKCPSLRYHLAGMKCFQLALSDERFLAQVFPEETSHRTDLRDITEEMFTIDQAMKDPVLQQRITHEPTSFYLKQSREGGGHVYCGSALKEQLDRIVADRQANRYFLMPRIHAPTHFNWIYSSGLNACVSKREINGELGIFGSLISQNGTLLSERVGGSLLRSKPAINIEGGIASGQGCIDSALLTE